MAGEPGEPIGIAQVPNTDGVIRLRFALEHGREHLGFVERRVHTPPSFWQCVFKRQIEWFPDRIYVLNPHKSASPWKVAASRLSLRISELASLWNQTR